MERKQRAGRFRLTCIPTMGSRYGWSGAARLLGSLGDNGFMHTLPYMLSCTYVGTCVYGHDIILYSWVRP